MQPKAKTLNKQKRRRDNHGKKAKHLPKVPKIEHTLISRLQSPKMQISRLQNAAKGKILFKTKQRQENHERKTTILRQNIKIGENHTETRGQEFGLLNLGQGKLG